MFEMVKSGGKLRKMVKSALKRLKNSTSKLVQKGSK